MSFRFSYYIFFTFFTFFIFCREYPEHISSKQLKGTGLYMEGSQLFWSINVGILQDSEFQEKSVAELRPVLRESREELSQILPGIKLKYVIDQPLNVVFIMERTLFRGKKEDLSAIMPIQGLSKGLAKSPLSKKLSFRDSTWRSYIGQQVRYDIILSNALIYPDKRERHPELLLWPDGSLRLALGAMPGRSAMESYGAYLSYIRIETKSPKKKAEGKASPLRWRPLRREEMRQTLTRGLLALVFPLDLSLIASPQKLAFFRSPRGRRVWEGYWKKRLSYLRAIAALHRGRAEACPQLYKNKIDYNTLRDTKTYFPGKIHSNILAMENAKFLALCPKK